MTFSRYQVGGSLSNGDPTYVERIADTELYQALKQGEFCYVLNSRQMGKSSLLVKTKHRLEQEGFKCAAIDMTNIGSENITPTQWYKGMVADLGSGFQLVGKFNLKTWWKGEEDLSLLHRFSRFIAQLLLVHFPKERIIIFIDEIDSILNLDFSVDDFFAFIRFCYNHRAIDTEYNRIAFAIFGVANPTDLIQDKTRTPFNIGKAIELQGFRLEEARNLAAGLAVPEANPQTILQEVLAWTGGQPFLTQKVCQLLVNAAKEAVNNAIAIAPATEANWVENVINSRIVSKWESQDEPQHLRTIRDRLLANQQIAGRLLGIYQQILAGEEVPTDDSREQIELLLSGLVVREAGKLKVKNRIYQAVFNFQWVAKQLENLRPYSLKFNQWIASKQQDESQLLKGIELQEALTWAESKKLSDPDYRFLAASQKLANQEIEINLEAEKRERQIEREKAQFALNAAKEAHKILAKARKSAKQNSQNLRLGKAWIPGISGTVAISVILLRFTGLLQGMEWNMLDRFFQMRPKAEIDPRIVAITIDESDIQRLGQYPLTDRTLVTALKTLKNYQPRVIGLDLYRDLPVEPGHQELVQLFKTTPNLIGVEKVVGNKVAPPPVLAELSQVGFADQVLDGDGKVRRALLSVRHSKSKLPLNLSLVLALRYLQAEGIFPQAVPNYPHQMRLGKAVLFPFQSNDGGYVRADTGGYQILLNFHGTQEQFQTYTLTDLLTNQIPGDKLRDRIVLIGATAESINNQFQTPYSSRIFGPPKPMPGTILHANITSQILSAAFQERPMLQVWPEAAEWLWILLWSGLGTALSSSIKSPKGIVAVILIAGLVIGSIAYLAFLQSWWIPVVPAIIGLTVATVTVPIVTMRQLEQIQLRQTIALLIASIREQPAAGQIAIEYLKQAENPENQALIERMLRESGSANKD